ncbi:MAG: hypothetical protein HKN13_07245 [Rhodothermales bacterium]|nr:hypothetical protein [Rhodothermales bacterium]
MDVQGRRRAYDMCPFCGYEFPQQKTSFVAIAILLVVLMLFFALYLM